MNKNYKLITSILVLPLILVVFSCKKKQNAQPINRAIVKIVDSSSTFGSNGSTIYITTYGFSYNKDSTLDKIAVTKKLYNYPFYTTNTIKNYSYFNNIIVIKDTAAYGTDTLYLNSNGMIVEESAVGLHYGYNSNGELNISLSGTQTDYYWLDGNINYCVYAFLDTGRYEYYTDKNIISGDGIQINEFILFGKTVMRNKNLIKAINRTSFKTLYSYTFDENNRIIKTQSTFINLPAADTTIDIYTISY